MGTLSEREEDFFKGPQGPGNQRGLPQALGLKLPDSDWGTQLKAQEEAHLNIYLLKTTSRHLEIVEKRTLLFCTQNSQCLLALETITAPPTS